VGGTAIGEIQFADYIFPAFDQVRFIQIYKRYVYTYLHFIYSILLIYSTILSCTDCQRNGQIPVPQWQSVELRECGLKGAMWSGGTWRSLS
jgi:hypothetical protein